MTEPVAGPREGSDSELRNKRKSERGRALRLLHSSDWHLGRLFHGVSLVDDQAHLLDAFAKLAEEAKVDAVLIAGDVYDRAAPHRTPSRSSTNFWLGLRANPGSRSSSSPGTTTARTASD